MGKFTMESGKMALLMEKETQFKQMVISMKEIGLIIKEKETVYLNLKMVTYIKDNGKKIKEMDKVNL